MFSVIYRTKSGKHVERVLAKAHAVIVEVRWTRVIFMLPKDTIFLRHAYHTLDTGQALHVLDVYRLSITDEVNLG